MKATYVVFLTLLFAPIQDSSAQPPSPVQTLQAATVFLRVKTATGEATGSGVLLSSSGLVATAAHVLKGAVAVRVRISTGEEFDASGVLDMNERMDLALVSIPGFSLPTASLGNSDSLAIGDRLIAIGAPLGLQGTLSDGLLSAIRIEDGTKLFQVSIPVSPGSSGGPVATQDGRVVGLVVSGIRGGGAENLNFVLPINYVRGRIAPSAARTPMGFDTMNGRIDASATAFAGSSMRNERAINDSLSLDWSTLDGVESTSEQDGGNGIRRKVRVSYAVSRTTDGRIRIDRFNSTRVRSKPSILEPTVDLAEDVVQTTFVVGGENDFTEGMTRTPLISSVQPMSSRVEVKGPMLSFSQSGAPSKRGEGLPRGLLPATMTGSVMGAYKGELPETLEFWVLDIASGQPIPAKWKRQKFDKTSIPLLKNGACVGDKWGDYKQIKVVVGTMAVGANRSEVTYRFDAPHILVSDELRCVRLP